MAYKLIRKDHDGTYHGLFLREGSWYGVEIETGRYVATSCRELGLYMKMSIYIDGKWETIWLNSDNTDFILENVPSTAGKMDFKDWLWESQWMRYQDYLNADTAFKKEIDDKYDDYVYSYQPQFVRRYMK